MLLQRLLDSAREEPASVSFQIRQVELFPGQYDVDIEEQQQPFNPLAVRVILKSGCWTFNE